MLPGGGGPHPGAAAVVAVAVRWYFLYMTGDPNHLIPANVQTQSHNTNNPHLQYFEKRRTESAPTVRGPGPDLQHQPWYPFAFNFAIPNPAPPPAPLAAGALGPLGPPGSVYRKLVCLGQEPAALAEMASAPWALASGELILFVVEDPCITGPHVGAFPLGPVDLPQLPCPRAVRCHTGQHPLPGGFAGRGLRDRVPLPAAGAMNEPRVYSTTLGAVRAVAAAGGAPAMTQRAMRRHPGPGAGGEGDWAVDIHSLQGRVVQFVARSICYCLFAAAAKLGIFYSNPHSDGAPLNCTYGTRFVEAVAPNHFAMANPPLGRHYHSGAAVPEESSDSEGEDQ